MMRCRQRQRGAGLFGLIFWVAIIVIAMVVGMRLVPVMTEYFAVTRIMDGMARGGDTTGSQNEIRASFNRKASVDNVTSVSGEDLEIVKASGGAILRISYGKKVPLAGPVSLYLDLSHTSMPK